MKNPSIISLCLLAITACQQATDTAATEPAPIDKVKIEQEVGAVMDQYYEASKGDKDLMRSIIADDAQLFGSAPENNAFLIKNEDMARVDALFN